MTRRIVWILAAAGSVAAASWLFVSAAKSPAAAGASVAAPAARMGRIAAPGVVEAASEEIAIRAELSGRLSGVLVEEGQHVAPLQTIATLEDGEFRAHLEAAEAEVQLRQAELQALLDGANQLQRREVWIGMKEAEAVVQQAKAEAARRQTLLAMGAISREEMERANSDLEVAQQRAEAATLRREMIGAHALDTDRKRAEAAVRAAQARLEEARLQLAKTAIHTPIGGTIVHRFQHAGELAAQMGNPIATVADLSQLRVRAEVDESDVVWVHTGEKAYVTAPAFGDRKFAGHVIRLASVLGKKNVYTGDPAERVDTRVLETLVELDPGTSLPLGLRVTTFILKDAR